MGFFSSSLRKLWKEWNLRAAVLLSLTLQIVLITLGNRRKNNHKLWIRIVVWCVYLSADVVATFALGVITNNVSDIYNEEGGSMDANTELTAFWTPFLLLHLGGPNTITAYALEDNELWLRHFLGLFVQTGMAIYVFIMAWTSSHLSILYLLMFVAGLIKYGERTWMLKKASVETMRESIAEEGMRFSFTYGASFTDARIGSDYTLFDAYWLMYAFYRPLFLDVQVQTMSIRFRSLVSEPTSLEDRFKITEMALGFMYDNLYTKAPLLHTRRGLGLRVITFFLTSSVLVLFLLVINNKDKFSNIDLTITFILLVGAIILEIYSAVLILSSDHFLVWLFMHGKFSTKKSLESFLPQKRWSNNMSQLSLLSFVMKEKPLPCPNILKLLRLDRKLEKQWYAADMEIPQNMKDLIFLYLEEKSRDRIPPIDDSIPVDRVDPVGPDFTEELEKSILAWHVATDIMYELDGENIKQHGSAVELHCGLICQISRYMFYLLVVHPNMISDGSMNQITLQSILWATDTVKFTSKTEACQSFEDLLTVSETNLIEHNLVERNKDDDIKIFLKDRLPGLLRKLSELALEERWKRISWTWLEMLSYAACKCKGIQHAQRLKTGGEFLTHVWFLIPVFYPFTHKDFTSHPPAPLFNSVMHLLNRERGRPLYNGEVVLVPTRTSSRSDSFDTSEVDTDPQI